MWIEDVFGSISLWVVIINIYIYKILFLLSGFLVPISDWHYVMRRIEKTGVGDLDGLCYSGVLYFDVELLSCYVLIIVVYILIIQCYYRNLLSCEKVLYVMWYRTGDLRFDNLLKQKCLLYVWSLEYLFSLIQMKPNNSFMFLCVFVKQY